MKITVELSEQELQGICEIKDVAKKGPAIRKLLEDSQMLQRRNRIVKKFLTGEWPTELDGYEAAKVANQCRAKNFAGSWRD
jgi:hypothetical protein